MSQIRAGFVHAFYLFDVAQAIDLARVRAGLGASASVAALTEKSAGPPRLRYIQPPVIADGRALGLAAIDGFTIKVKFYDYGVISLSLARPFAGSWADLVATAQDLIENDALQQRAAEACQAVVDRTRASLDDVRSTFLDEDYLVLGVTALEEPLDAETLLERHGDHIAQLLRGERQPLSRAEREEALRHRLSYLADDLVIPAWSAAFVYEPDLQAAAATLEILEFANAQLLEFRYHDDLLETELGRIYAELQRPRWTDRMLGRRHRRAAIHLHSLFIDVNELTDRVENALKLVGEVYSARLFTLAGTRLGLDAWKRSVEEKLKTLDDIYRFAVELTGMSQANLLELVIVLILVLELGLLLAGIMK